MKNEGIKYNFSAKPYQSSSSTEMCGWTFVSMPNDLASEIRENFKRMEEGWGRLKVSAKIGNSEWKTSIWFDTKQDTYLLPLKAEIRKKENISLDNEVEISIFI
jgi:Domain of unknown function (DUF1905).